MAKPLMVSSVTVAVVPREGFSHVRLSLESLYASTELPIDVLYIDGGSPWPISAYLRRESKRRGFRLIRLERFLSPNEARNIALAHARSDYIYFADNDIFYQDGWLERLLATADLTGAALVGPLVSTGEAAERPFEKVHGAQTGAHVTDDGTGRHFRNAHPHAHQDLAQAKAHLISEACEAIEFHGILARRDMLQHIGGFDEALTSAFEHLDLCMQVRLAGGVVYFEPRAVIHQYLPPKLPRGLLSLPFFLQRWSTESNEASERRFREKWMLREDDITLAEHAHWLRERRWIVFTRLLKLLGRLGFRAATIAAGRGEGAH